MKRSRRYRSYLLRLWETGSDEKTVWRASLESPATGERQGFASLKDLFTFLESQTKVEINQKLETDDRTRGAEF